MIIAMVGLAVVVVHPDRIIKFNITGIVCEVEMFTDDTYRRTPHARFFN
jgi:hypothetical protein